ncbi:MAG: hypothetical protein ABWW65_00605 [Thermoprotei archaeon]
MIGIKNAYYKTLPVIIMCMITFSISAYLHHPKTPILLDNWGFKYSDIVYGVFYTRFSPDLGREEVVTKWYNVEQYYELIRGRKTYPIPYIDYMFEYPPLIGLLWYISTNIAFSSLPQGYNISYYRAVFPDLATIHYYVNLAALFVLYVVGFSIIFKTSINRALLYAILPSTILYVAYNWDIVAGALLLLSLLMYMRKRFFYSGIFAGLAVSTKLLPLIPATVLGITLLTKYYRGNTNFTPFRDYALGLFIAGFAPFLLLLILSPRGFIDFVTYHSTWYCENCLSQLFVNDIFSPFHKVFSSILIAAIFLLTLTIINKHINRIDEITPYLIMLLTIATLVFNYVFTPQMMLIITPLALYTVRTKEIYLYSIADITNALIMIFFFKDSEIRAFLNYLGFPVTIEFNPWTLPSLTQITASIRNVLLLILVAEKLYKFYIK